MADEPNLFEKMMSKLSAAQAEAAPNPERNAFQNPAMKNAQARSTGYYFRTGENRPIDDFVNDPTLK